MKKSELQKDIDRMLGISSAGVRKAASNKIKAAALARAAASGEKARARRAAKKAA